MKGEKLLVTQKDINRFKVLKDVIEKRLKGAEAAQLLGLSVVHISRLKKHLLVDGFEGLLRKSPLVPPHNKILKQEKLTRKLLNQREYHVVPLRNIYHPPIHHPWRKFVYGKPKLLEK